MQRPESIIVSVIVFYNKEWYGMVKGTYSGNLEPYLTHCVCSELYE